MQASLRSYLLLIALLAAHVLAQGPYYYMGELMQSDITVTTTIGQAGGGWCIVMPWNTDYLFPPTTTQDIFLVGYVIEPYLPTGSVAVSNWTFQAYEDNAGVIGNFIPGTRLEVTGATWSKSSPANDCDYVRPINTTITDAPFARQELLLPTKVKLPRNISAGSFINFWTCVWSNPQIPLFQLGANSFMYQENGTGFSLIIPPPPGVADGNKYPGLSWLTDVQPRIAPPTGTLGAVKVSFGNVGATNDGTYTNAGVTVAAGIAVQPITDAKVYAISGIGIYTQAAATGTFLFAIYGQKSQTVNYQPSSFALANTTVTSLTAGANYIPLPSPLFISINISQPTVYFIYFASSVDVQIRLSTDPAAQQAFAILLGDSRKEKCIPNLALQNLFLQSDFEGLASGLSVWLNISSDATIDPALTTTPAATTPPVVVTTAPPTTSINDTFAPPTTVYTIPNSTFDPNSTIQTAPNLDNSQPNLGGDVGSRTDTATTPPPTTKYVKPKYKVIWKLIARIMDSCLPYPGTLIAGYDPALYLLSYDGCGRKKYYQSTLQVAFDGPTANAQYAALNKTGLTLVLSQIADSYVMVQVKSKPPMIIVWVLLGILGAVAAVIVVSVCGYYCCRGWVYEMLGKEEEDYGVDL